MSDFDIRSGKMLSWWRNRLTTEDSSDGVWTHGSVMTPNGIVYVSAEIHFGSWETASFEMVYGGKVYSARLRKYYSARYLVTLATRFAKQVTS